MTDHWLLYFTRSSNYKLIASLGDDNYKYKLSFVIGKIIKIYTTKTNISLGTLTLNNLD